MTHPIPKSFSIKSFGCQMNVYDGQRMAEMLEADGMVAAAEPASADLVVLNTCHIRERAAEKVYSDIGRLKRDDGTRPMIAVAGCVAQAEGEEIVRRAKVDVVVGPQAYHNLPDLVARAAAGAPARAEELLSSAQNELRALVEVLRPADLTGGLSPALERLAERTAGLLEVTLEANSPANLPPAHAETLYRAAQEGVHNALKHAQATRLRLRCVGQEGVIVLTLEDDGVGLSEPLQEGFGLRSLRDRAVRLGGSLQVETRRSGGTRLELTLPYG